MLEHSAGPAKGQGRGTEMRHQRGVEGRERRAYSSARSGGVRGVKRDVREQLERGSIMRSMEVEEARDSGGMA